MKRPSKLMYTWNAKDTLSANIIVAQLQTKKNSWMKKKVFLVAVLLIAVLLGCRKDNEDQNLHFDYSFQNSTEGWQPFFSDYPVGEDEKYELEFNHSPLPEELDEQVKSIKIGGLNHSDDLLSVIYRKIDNLQPNSNYSVYFDIELASDACSKCAGIGGDPSLSLGAGGVAFEPKNTTEEGDVDYHRPNFTTRIQSHESNDVAQVLGRIGVDEDPNTPFKLKKFSNSDKPIVLKTDDKGQLWVVIGIDSGFEGKTILYYKSINIRMIKN